jgi:hypothetical protein
MLTVPSAAHVCFGDKRTLINAAPTSLSDPERTFADEVAENDERTFADEVAENDR